MSSIFGRMIAIVVCGAAGALAAAGLTALLMLEGLPGALVAVLVAMGVATAAFAGWTALARRLQRTK
jgi:hypothetical protein